MTDENEDNVGSSDEGQDWGRDRKGAMSDADLSPLSLAGSWYHRVEGGDIVEHGIVIGEVSAKVYLVESEAPEKEQRLVQLAQMIESEGGEWRFFDTAEAMREAYARITLAERAERG